MMQCKDSLRKIPKFHLISWCGNFVETHSFRRVLGDSHQELYGNCAFPHYYHTRKLGKIMVFYAVYGGYFLSLLTLSVLQRDQKRY